jgi:hypothetical protein
VHFPIRSVTNTENSAFVAAILLSWDLFDLFNVLCNTCTDMWNSVSGLPTTQAARVNQNYSLTIALYRVLNRFSTYELRKAKHEHNSRRVK